MGYQLGLDPCEACKTCKPGRGHCFGGNWLTPHVASCTCECRKCFCEPQVSNGIGDVVLCDYCKTKGKPAWQD